MNTYQSNNLIVLPFAFDSNMRSGANVKTDILETYLKNAIIAAVSTKRSNPEDVVMFATNIHTSELPAWFVSIINDNDIAIEYIPFDKIRFEKNVKWGLAFYKLNVFAHIIEATLCERVCYMDIDVYIQGSFKNIWRECDENLLLYDIGHGLQVPNYNNFVSELAEFGGG